MKHIKREHTDQIEWLENNSLIVRKAIFSPNFIDALPFQNKKRWAVTHVLEIGDDLYDLLVVGIKHGKSFSEKHSILTMFLAGKRFVLDEFGNVKPRWKKIK